MKNLAILFFSILILSVQGQNTVQPVDQTNSNNGIFYSLPQSVIKVSVTVEKQSFYAGPLATYADEFLGIEGIPTSDEQSFSFKSVTFEEEVIPDPEHFYFVEFNADEMKGNRAFKMVLNESGLLTGYNQKRGALKQTQNKTVVIADNQAVDKGELFDFQEVTGMELVVDTIIRMITVDTNVVKEMSFNRQWMRRTSKEKAQEVAEKIQQIIKDRYYLSVGYQEVAYDPGTIEYMDEQLLKRQQEYEALFKGKTIVSEQTYHFEMIPKKAGAKDQKILFKFSTRSGIRSAGSSIGDPVYLVVQSDQTTKNIEGKAEAMLSSNKARKGIYYRIPDYANVSLDYKEESLHTMRMVINQMGVVSFAPYSEEMGFELHPKTGSLKAVDLQFKD